MSDELIQSDQDAMQVWYSIESAYNEMASREYTAEDTTALENFRELRNRARSIAVAHNGNQEEAELLRELLSNRGYSGEEVTRILSGEISFPSRRG